MIERDGAPVFYLRNGKRDLYSNIIYQIWDYLPKNKQPGLGFNILGGLCKGMSNPDTDDYEYLHEAEWRIVHNDHLSETGSATWRGLEESPIAYLPFSQVDLKLIIVPDEETRNMLFESEKIQTWLSKEREESRIENRGRTKVCDTK